MHTIYLVSPRTLPPSPATWLAALASRQRMPPGPCTVTHEDAVWDHLTLRVPLGEVTARFTLGAGLPARVAEDWLPWAGRSLTEAEREVVAHPAAAYRLHLDSVCDGFEPLCFLMEAAVTLAALTDGVLIDVAAQRIWSAAQAGDIRPPAEDVRSWISVHAEPREDAGFDLHTHGMERFGSANAEICGVPDLLLGFGVRALNEVAQHQVAGHTLRHGDTVIVGDAYAFALSATARSAEHCESRVLALLDLPEAPSRDICRPANTFAQVAEDTSGELVAEGRFQEGLTWAELACSLAPWRLAARRKRVDLLEMLGGHAAACADRDAVEELQA